MKTLIADKFSEAHIARLNQLGCEVTYNPTARAEELPGLIAPCKILVVRGKQVTAETLKAADELALVLRAGAGVNTIDVKTASARGVFVSNCPGKNSIAVAELVFALLLAIDRRIPGERRRLARPQVEQEGILQGRRHLRQDPRGRSAPAGSGAR